MEKKAFNLLLLLISIFLIAIFSLLTMEDFKKESLDKENVHNVTNISTFYTVESCVNKYVSYLMKKDYKVIYNLLDDNYINKNHVNKNNLNKYIKFYDRNYSFKTENMYKYKDSNIYYVKGKLIEEGMDITKPDEKDFKTTIKLDKTNNKFSVIPDGDGGILDD